MAEMYSFFFLLQSLTTPSPSHRNPTKNSCVMNKDKTKWQKGESQHFHTKLQTTGFTFHSTSPKPPWLLRHDILISIENELSGLDTRFALIELLHKEFQVLHHSLEFSQEQIKTVSKENKTFKQCRSRRKKTSWTFKHTVCETP